MEKLIQRGGGWGWGGFSKNVRKFSLTFFRLAKLNFLAFSEQKVLSLEKNRSVNTFFVRFFWKFRPKNCVILASALVQNQYILAPKAL